MSQNNRYMAVSVTDTKADTKRPKIGGQSRGTGEQDASVAALERELAIYKRDSGIEMEELRTKVNNMPKGGGAGEPGKDGVGIESVEQTVTSTESGGENKVEITLTDGQKTEIVIRNGKDGKDGEGGGEGGSVTPESIGAVQSKALDTIGTSTTIADTICNYAAKGVYSGQFQAADNVSDNPEPNWAFAIEFVNAGGDTVCIRAHKLYTDIVYIRQINIASGQYMSNWAMFYSTGNKPTAADIGAAERNSTHLSETADLNTITDEGEYYYGWWQETIQNSPVHSAFHLSVNRISADEVSQTYTQYTGGENVVWFRQSNNGKTTWYAWKKIATTDQIPTTAADVGAVSKSGDTMAGTLSFASASEPNGWASIYKNHNATYDGGTNVSDYDKNAKNVTLKLQANANKISFYDTDSVEHPIYHTGNKPTAADVGARPNTWLPTPGDIGAIDAYVGVVNGTDIKFDTAFKQGEYSVTSNNNTDDTPPYNLNGGYAYGKLIVTINTGDEYNGSWNWMWQTYYPTSGGAPYIRSRINNGAFSSWQRIATTDYIDEQILKGEW